MFRSFPDVSPSGLSVALLSVINFQLAYRAPSRSIPDAPNSVFRRNNVARVLTGIGIDRHKATGGIPLNYVAANNDRVRDADRR